MSGNTSSTDRLIRFIAAIFFFLAGFFLHIPTFLSIVLYVVCGILFVTAVIGWCPCYFIIGHSTKKTRLSRISKGDIERAVRDYPVNVSSEIEQIRVSSTPPKKKVSKKAPVKKATVKKASVSTTTKKAPAKKKVVSKKTINTVKKSPAKKPAIKKASVSTTTKKAPVRKVVSKKTSSTSKKKTTSKKK